MADATVKAGTVTSLASKFGGMKKIVGGVKAKSKGDSNGSNGYDSGLVGQRLATEEADSLKEHHSIRGYSEVEGRNTPESQKRTEINSQMHDNSPRKQLSDTPITTQELFVQKPQSSAEVVENFQLPSLERKTTDTKRLWDITAELRRQSFEEPEVAQPKTSEDWAKEYQSLLDYSWLCDNQVSRPNTFPPKHRNPSKPRLAALARAATGVINKSGHLGTRQPGEGVMTTWDDLKHKEDLEDRAGQQIRGEQLKLVDQGLVRICPQSWKADENGLTRITGRSNKCNHAMEKLARVRDGRGYIDYSHNR